MYECKQSYRIARLARPGGIQRERKARSDIRRAIRCEVINTYGGKCVCCDEIEHRFLTIDHINGDGKKHRYMAGFRFMYWIKRNNYPSDLRILCMNCNFAIRMGDACPHTNNSHTTS